MIDKVFCSYYKKLCKHCSDNDILCNEVEREGVSYLDCRFATKPNGEFKVVVTCGVCGSNNVDDEIVTYYEDGYSRVVYTCNNCNNKSR